MLAEAINNLQHTDFILSIIALIIASCWYSYYLGTRRRLTTEESKLCESILNNARANKAFLRNPDPDAVYLNLRCIINCSEALLDLIKKRGKK